ncbi:MAG: hypothetical protein WKF68_12365 [Daejeonella sp.]
MEQSELLQKLDELHKGQIALQHRLDMILEKVGEKQWLDSCDLRNKYHISKSTLYRLKKNLVLKPKCLGKKDFYCSQDVERAIGNE